MLFLSNETTTAEAIAKRGCASQSSEALKADPT
jgi:hypothetical protein